MPKFKRERPEAKIQEKLTVYLEVRGWLVEVTHGSAFMKGFPDLYIAHPKWGSRWIDVKVEGHYSFTKAQRMKWPLWEKFGIGIWILTGADQANYDRLFAKPNMWDYWKPQWKTPTIEDALKEFDL